MKTLLASLCLLAITTLGAQSFSDDHAAIAKTVNYYLEGGTNGDFEMLKKAFHPEAKMTYLSNGEYKSVNAIEFFEKGMKNSAGRKSDRETRIASIDLAGHAAVAKLEIVYSTFKFIDYMQLLKIDGEWKIISKSFYREKTTQAEG
jgi:hypothetical protein